MYCTYVTVYNNKPYQSNNIGKLDIRKSRYNLLDEYNFPKRNSLKQRHHLERVIYTAVPLAEQPAREYHSLERRGNATETGAFQYHLTCCYYWLKSLHLQYINTYQITGWMLDKVLTLIHSLSGIKLWMADFGEEAIISKRHPKATQWRLPPRNMSKIEVISWKE